MEQSQPVIDNLPEAAPAAEAEQPAEQLNTEQADIPEHPATSAAEQQEDPAAEENTDEQTPRS